MDQKSFDLLNKLFDQAISSADPKAFLSSLDIADELRSELSGLLDCHFQETAFPTHLALQTQLDQIVSSPEFLFQPGSVLEDFEVIECIGRGAFGAVFKAQDHKLGRIAAIKITPNVGSESEAMARLEHEAIVPIYSEKVLAKENLRLLCMPYIRGANLETLLYELHKNHQNSLSGKGIVECLDRLGAKPETFDSDGVEHRHRLSELDYESALLFLLQPIVKALIYAHGRDVLHLDVKPGNILVDGYGRAKLTDFNISALSQREESVLGGTAGFMAPEQKDLMEGEKAQVDGRSDIYAFGRVLEYALCYSKRITGENDHAMSVVEQCTAIDMNSRPSDAFSLEVLLKGALHSQDMSKRLAVNISTKMQDSGLSLWLVAAAIFLPQFLGSIINIFYNHQQIISELTSSQREVFIGLLAPYNLVIYPLCFFIAFRKIWRLYKSGKKTHRFDKKTLCEWLGVGKLVVFISSLGWLPGAVFFPMMIDLNAGPLGFSIYLHFALSFLTSWLVATTYSYYLVQVYLVNFVLPKFVSPLWSMAEVGELKLLSERVGYGVYAAGAVPLLAALMVLFMVSTENTLELKVFLALLITIGMIGFTLIYRLTEYLKKILAIFTSV